MKRLVVFVHGLGGNPDGTWKGGGPGFRELIASDPKLRNCEAVFFQYATSVRPWSFRKLPSLSELASGLRAFIESREGHVEDVVLVGHSLGGLVVRQYLVDEVKRGADVHVSRVILFATPNNGSDLATWAKAVPWHHAQLRQLARDSDGLNSLNTEWARHDMDSRLKIYWVVGDGDRVVSLESARGQWGTRVTVIALRDHSSLVKPTSHRDEVFEVLRKALGAARVRSSAIDFSHGQLAWTGLAAAAAGFEFAGFQSSIAGNEETLDRCSLFVVPSPRSKVSEDEVRLLKRWVQDGGGLLCLGHYAADTHHEDGNPSLLARAFGCRFREDLVMPEGSSKDDCRAQVFGDSPALRVRVEVPHGQAFQSQGVETLAVQSSCTIDSSAAVAEPIFKLFAPDSSLTWSPLGHLTEDGLRPAIDEWKKDDRPDKCLVVAFPYGRGRVALVGTWKMLTLNDGGNRPFMRELMDWLHAAAE